MPAYSSAPLVSKLGIRENFRILLRNAPDNFYEALGKLPPGIRFFSRPGKNLNYIHIFAIEITGLEAEIKLLKKYLLPNGMLWVSWIKKTSSAKSSFGENEVRKAGLNAGLVDVKICSVDDTWSGLKFVFRIADRKS